jgi:predicted ArsR family transcriptional regulator
MTRDPIAEFLPYLTPWFSTPRIDLMTLTDTEKMVLDELSTGWKTTTPKHELLQSIAADYGQDTVNAVLDQVVAAHIRMEWAELAASQPSAGIDDLHRLLWEPLREAGFVFTVDRILGKSAYRCTSCPNAKLGEVFGIRDFMYHLVCSGDEPMTEGFNPKIRFSRTCTLMEGGEYCDHTYLMSE